MKKTILDYDAFVNEGYTPSSVSADVFNTPGMGNVGGSSFSSSVADDETASGDAKKSLRHLKMHERGHHDNSWMKPSGDYSQRNWLVPNYEIYQNERQSMTRFQIGQAVRCVNKMHESFGKVGKIIAFEDNTIRWELAGSATGIGQSSVQYRCPAQDLDLVK